MRDDVSYSGSRAVTLRLLEPVHDALELSERDCARIQRLRSAICAMLPTLTSKPNQQVPALRGGLYCAPRTSQPLVRLSLRASLPYSDGQPVGVRVALVNPRDNNFHVVGLDAAGKIVSAQGPYFLPRNVRFAPSRLYDLELVQTIERVANGG
jgi:hypothetical protein